MRRPPRRLRRRTTTREGRPRYEVDIDLSAGTGRCNCSICKKARHWGTVVKPEAFRLLRGEEELSDYQFATHSQHHYFCRHCGIRPFGKGHVEALGGAYYAINPACLDDLPEAELAEANVIFLDGRNDDWEAVPAETRHL